MNITLDVYRDFIFPNEYAESLATSQLLHTTFLENKRAEKDALHFSKVLAWATIQHDIERLGLTEGYDISADEEHYDKAEWHEKETDKDDMIEVEIHHIASSTHRNCTDVPMIAMSYKVQVQYKKPIEW